MSERDKLKGRDQLKGRDMLYGKDRHIYRLLWKQAEKLILADRLTEVYQAAEIG